MVTSFFGIVSCLSLGKDNTFVFYIKAKVQIDCSIITEILFTENKTTCFLFFPRLEKEEV